MDYTFGRYCKDMAKNQCLKKVHRYRQLPLLLNLFNYNVTADVAADYFF